MFRTATILFLIAAAGFLHGCASMPAKKISDAEKNAYIEDSRKLETLSGDVWVQLRTPDRQLGFSAQIWMKLGDEKKAGKSDEIRMEISGPFGADLGLLILYFDQKLGKSILMWVDLERGKTERYVEYWYDIPLKSLGHVLAGIPIATSQANWEFEQEWQWNDRYGRQLLATIAGRETASKQNARSLTVKFREHERYGEFFLPKEIDLSSSLSILLNMTWRTRHWNESLPAEAFLPVK